MKEISSLQNSQIKNTLRLLTKAKERKEQNLFVFEGARELSLALAGGYTVEQLYVCADLLAKSDYAAIVDKLPSSTLYSLSKAVFEKIAYREGSDGVVAVAKPKEHHLEDLPQQANPFYIVLESIEKPGNLGAILRTADAAKVDGVIVCDPTTDVYNPNVIRSSVGCVFTVPVAVCTSSEAVAWLAKNQISSYAAELRASSWYHQADFTSASAVLMGTEADGLSDFWLQAAQHRIKIPMRGVIDSLNVSVSTAVIVFEAMRQRGFC